MTTELRQPAVAGMFYPDDADGLEHEVRGLLGAVTEQHELLACIAPHAGYVYSGHVAGRLFSHLKMPRRLVLLGPNHSGLGAGVAIAPHAAWRTPIADVPVDSELAALLEERFSEAHLDARAHWREHSIEVQLPFLQLRRHDLTVLPVCLQHLTLHECLELGTAVARTIQTIDEPVGLVASSDMSHYEPDETARARDRQAIDAALTLDPSALYETVHRLRISMCGVIPATVALAAAIELGADQAELVAYATSGDVSGDRSAVVGYAGICVFKRG